MDATNYDASFEEIWGKAAKMTLPPVPMGFRIQVHDRFFLGPLRRSVEIEHGSFTRDALDEFCQQAMQSYFERYKSRKTPMDLERAKLVATAVPTPMRTDHPNILKASLDGKCRQETLARLLMTRTKVTKQGQSMAFREALFEAVQQTLLPLNGDAEAPTEDLSEE